MKLSNIWIILFVILIAGGLFFALNGGRRLQQWRFHLEDGSNVHAYIGVHPFFLEVANSPASITQGLSGRSQIGADGMLFILPDTEIPTFWMKGMLFDLDFVWLNQGKIVEVTEKAVHPQPDTPDSNLKIYSPHEPVDQVLELQAGQVKSLQLQVGDQLEIK